MPVRSTSCRAEAPKTTPAERRHSTGPLSTPSGTLAPRSSCFGDQIAAEFDIVLVDSRTGITDSSSICTVQLPDLLAMVFTANEQSLDGTCMMAERIQSARDRLDVDRARLPIVPLLSRFDAREEKRLGEQWIQRIASRLASEWPSPPRLSEYKTQRSRDLVKNFLRGLPANSMVTCPECGATLRRDNLLRHRDSQH